MLGELAELGLMLARELAVEARAAEDAGERVALADAFQKTSRAVRLTLALDFKLERDAAREAREEQALAERREAQVQAEAQALAEAALAAERASAPAPPVNPVRRHKDRVRGVLNRLLWTESEGDTETYDVLMEDLDVRLAEAARAEGFTDMPVELLAQRLKADMGLAGALVVTTAERLCAPAVRPPLAPPLADTG
ncbi:MAG TPA: hypothetical protein VGG92_19400 [Caulobacteraceae bacterium]